jgi:hypothetical protein
LRNYLQRLKSTLNPDQYHGWGKESQYLEGWYFKMVDAGQTRALAVIPGISMDKQGKKHAFVQVMDGTANEAAYHRFEAHEFRPARHLFEVAVGKSRFSKQQLALDASELGLGGEIRHVETTPWPKMLGAPGIMGWFSFVPFMQCFHGVVSLHHGLEGSLEWKGQTVDFTGGRGYIEKDWGRSFPRGYVWMQTNHFDGFDRASMIASVAHIPWLGSYFIGFIAGFWLEGKLFRFATYTGAKKHLSIQGNTVELSFHNPRSSLQILASQAKGTALISPISGAMTGKINESLAARISVELYVNGSRIFEGSSRTSGLELAGNLEVLLG